MRNFFLHKLRNMRFEAACCFATPRGNKLDKRADKLERFINKFTTAPLKGDTK